jgi:ubiquinone/menaquinone biosynthesis C-methylase UbiE
LKTEEFHSLSSVEENHWFYSGKRAIARHWIEQMGFLQPDFRLIEVGAGTGLFASEMHSLMKVIALDVNPTALSLIRERNQVPIISAMAEHLPIKPGSVDVITALDVIEHIDDDRDALEGLVNATRKGGIIILTVPAYQFLWSEWDIALNHRRRYTYSDILKLSSGLNVDIVHLSYINTVAFIPIIIYRFITNIVTKDNRRRRMEEWIPYKPLNDLLRFLFVKPAQSKIFYPFGLSILCILTRQ